MRSEIKLLSEDTVQLIAAGEVIDSVAAVVRELAENALDAGATRISIALWTDPWRIRVADNGMGMSRADLEQAAIAHTTSKIRTASDLWNIGSLGFRGEALHSLAQLSVLQIASRPLARPTISGRAVVKVAGTAVNSAHLHRAEDEDEERSVAEGWAITYTHHGNPDRIEPVAIAPGTIVTVESLFATLPGRQQGLPPVSQQLRAVQSTIYQLALCHPHVTWQLQQHDRDWLAIFPGASPRHLLPQFVRDVQFTDLEELHWPLDRPNGPEVQSPRSPWEPSLDVVVGLPDRCHRHRPDWVRVAVNGRCVRFPELEQTILAGFRRTLPRDRYPVCFVHLHAPPDQIDWNRHPAKTELYLHHLDDWREQVAQAIAAALQSHPTALPESLHSSRMGAVLKTAEALGQYHLGRQQLDPDHTNVAKTEVAKLDAPKAIAQVHQMYILAEHPTGILLIEQHIAHERVLYEQLCDRWHLVPLDPPLLLNDLSPAQLEQLERLGITVEPFGEHAWAARSAPELLATRDDCAEALIELSLGGDLPTAQAATACRSAIRNGTPLTPSEMQTLLNQWHQTRQPRTCPHGRPICLTLEESSLSRFFRRHWMIGKSHGI